MYFHYIFILFLFHFYVIFIFFNFIFIFFLSYFSFSLFLFLSYFYFIFILSLFSSYFILLFYQNFVHLAYMFFTRSYSNQRIEVLKSVQVTLQLSFTKTYSIESHSYYKTTIPWWIRSKRCHGVVPKLSLSDQW